MRAAAVLSGAVLVATAAGTFPGHGSVAETCFGLAPTVTAGAGASVVRGTEGDDVVIAAEVEQVETFGGNDAVCVAGSALIDAGSGDDRVMSTAATGGSLVFLGSGSDQFEGSSGDDEVWAEQVEDGRSTPGAAFVNADTIRTGAGADIVHTGVWVHRNDDDVDLGEGRDVLHLAGNAGAARLTGGGGRDRIATWLVDAPLPAVTYDLGAGQGSFLVSGQEQVFATLDGFEDVSVSGSPATPVTVRGSSEMNRIVVRQSSTLDPGAGRVRVTASGRSDVVTVAACGAAVDGGRGQDRLRVDSTGCGRVRATLRGGPGGDVLRGGGGPDVLLGGTGRDRATGHQGFDRCRAEVEKGCEGD